MIYGYNNIKHLISRSEVLSLYIKRHIENAVERTARMFGAVIVTGPRQVGKTTLLRNFTGDMAYVTLDDPIILQSAVNETGTFFKDYPPPVFVDEIQYAPALFPYIWKPRIAARILSPRPIRHRTQRRRRRLSQQISPQQ